MLFARCTLSLSLSLSFFSLSLYLIVHPFYCILLKMSRERALLTLLSRTSPLRGRFRKEYLISMRNLSCRRTEMSNEHPKLYFQFHLYHMEDIHFRDDTCEIVVSLHDIFNLIEIKFEYVFIIF